MVNMTNDTTYLLDNFAILERLSDTLLKIRLFPFGRVIKDGVERIITPELAARFKLPHFRPPLKIGGHAVDAVGGGLIVGLEVGEDGLYGLVNVNDRGNQAIEEKQYGFHSPEVIWDDGFLEHPDTGEPIHGPLIVGDALVHTPHLGEAAALFSVEPILDGGTDAMADNTVPVPIPFWEKLMARFDRPEDDPEPAPQPQVQQEDYAAEYQEAQGKIETLTAELHTLRAEQEREARVAHFATELPDEGEGLHALLAGLDEGDSEAIATRFKALYAQIEQQPDADVGNAGNPDEGLDPSMALDAVVQAYAAEHGVNYPTALAAVAKEQPELVTQYQGGNK
jgi:hypothetical protein